MASLIGSSRMFGNMQLENLRIELLKDSVDLSKVLQEIESLSSVDKTQECYPSLEILESIGISGFNLSSRVLSGDKLESMLKRLQTEKTRSTEIVLLGHFSVADMSMFSDYEDKVFEGKVVQGLKRSFDILRGSNTSILQPFTLSGGRTKIYLRDTGHLSMPGTPLASLGAYYGLEKVDLKLGLDLDYNPITNMRRYSKEQPHRFREYGMRDAEIALVHGLTVQELMYNRVGLYIVPTTLNAIVRRLVLGS